MDQFLLDHLAKCRNSTKMFASTFFPDRFFRTFTAMHDAFFKVLDDDSIKKAVIIAPRGIGKTTLLSEIYPLKRILYRDSHYIISVGASEGTATEQTENVKKELQSNDLIRAVFGDFSSSRLAKEEWVIKFSDGDEVKVMPRGAGQAVRGRRFKQYRPDILIVDDLENDKHMRSEIQRADKKAWFFSSLMNIVDVYSDDWRIIVVGTILHEDSLLSNLMELDDWYKVVLPIADENLHSNIPEWRSDKWIQELRESYIAAGQPEQFYMEFMCTVLAGETATFKKEYFKYYDEMMVEKSPFLETIIMSDPARTTNTLSCDTAIMAISIDTRNDALYVRDLEVGKMSPDEHNEKVLSMADKYKAKLLAPEVTGLENYIIYPLKEAMLQRYGGRKFYQIANDGKGIKPIKSKEDRAKALIPWFKRGAVYFNKAVTSSLEQALLSFPRCKRWDALDCLSNVIDVLDEGYRFLGLKQEESLEDIEKEFAKLSIDCYEDLGDSWKRI